MALGSRLLTFASSATGTRLRCAMLISVSPRLTTCTLGGALDRRRGNGGLRRSQRGRRGGRGLMRNDQLLAGLQRARALVAVGLQDRGGRNVVAARQRFQRVAGADDDGGRRLRAPAHGSRRSSAARRCRWSRSADGSAENRMRLPRPPPDTPPARIGLRCGDRRRQGRRLILRLRARILRQLAALDLGRRRGDRGGGFRLRGEGIGEGVLRQPGLRVGAAAGKPKRHQRQHRDLRSAARAKQLDDTGHGYSLIRNKLLN